jgi:hypothetical protein
MDVAKRGGLTRFWLKRCWVRDVRYLTYAKHEGVGDFFCKWGSSGFRGVCWFGCDVGGMSGVVGWPNTDTNPLLVCRGDF